MSNILFTNIPDNTIRIVVDIEFTDGSFRKGVIIHSFVFEPQDHWSLKIYATKREEINHTPTEMYWGVKKINVVGIRL